MPITGDAWEYIEDYARKYIVPSVRSSGLSVASSKTHSPGLSHSKFGGVSARKPQSFGPATRVAAPFVGGAGVGPARGGEASTSGSAPAASPPGRSARRVGIRSSRAVEIGLRLQGGCFARIDAPPVAEPHLQHLAEGKGGAAAKAGAGKGPLLRRSGPGHPGDPLSRIKKMGTDFVRAVKRRIAMERELQNGIAGAAAGVLPRSRISVYAAVH